MGILGAQPSIGRLLEEAGKGSPDFSLDWTVAPGGRSSQHAPACEWSSKGRGNARFFWCRMYESD